MTLNNLMALINLLPVENLMMTQMTFFSQMIYFKITISQNNKKLNLKKLILISIQNHKIYLI